jgi:DNA polymerase-3 subunit delta'
MNDLLVHAFTQQQMEQLVASPSHAVILAGSAGSGKYTLAIGLTEAILGLRPQGFADYPYKIEVVPEDGKPSIGIEAVRGLEHFLSLKVPSSAAYNRAIIIENSQLLTPEAQNALLKTLEEPPAGVFVILTVTSEQALLPTIRSRAQSVAVKRPDRPATEAYFEAKGFAIKPIQQAYAISGGLPGLMQALLESSEHPLLLATQKARQLLSQSAYERLLLADELAKQRSLALDTAFILQQMAHVSLQTATGPAAAKWQSVLTAAYQAAEALSTNAQSKLVLTNLMLSL